MTESDAAVFEIPEALRDALSPDSLSFNQQADYALAWNPSDNASQDMKSLASYLTWAMGNANAQLLEEVNRKMDQQIRLHAATFTMYQTKISSLEKQNAAIQQEPRQEIYGLKNGLRRLREQQTTTLPPNLQPVQAIRGQKSAQTQPAPLKPQAAQQQAWKPTTNQAVVDDEGFQTVESKKKKKERLLPKPYPRAQREVIFEMESASSDPVAAANQALRIANKTIVDHKDITKPPFILSRVTPNNSLILTTAIDQQAIDYEQYLGILKDALFEAKPVAARVNTRWTKFLLHSVPTYASLEEVRLQIETNYPLLKMGQTLRWLTSPEKREGKAHSTMVLAVIGTMTLKTLGVSHLAVCNRLCPLDEYYPYGPNTQCNICQQYGHHPKKCTADPVCAVCAKPHPTKEHPCTVSSCKKGPACTHPPIKCAVCGNAHKASDPNCPTRTKMELLRRPGPEPALAGLD
jgi:hypothetical protein